MSKYLGVDVGEKRVGLAIASEIARLPSPFLTLENSEDIIDRLLMLIKDESVTKIVVGLPLNRYGKSTQQTQFTEEFIERLTAETDVPIATCDETLSSVRAEKELATRKKGYKKEEVDSLAAAYILEDYFREKGLI